MLWRYLVGTRNFLDQLTLMKLWLLLDVIEIMTFGSWIHWWTYNNKLSHENKPLQLLLSFFTTREHPSKISLHIIHLEVSTYLQCQMTSTVWEHHFLNHKRDIFFQIFGHINLISSMYSSILGKSNSLAKYILLVITQNKTYVLNK